MPLSSPGIRRSSVALGAVVALSLMPIAAIATPAAAAPLASAAVTTQRMSQPTLASSQAGWYTKGSRLSLSCYVHGQSVKGYFSPWVGNGGWDDLWYRVSDGYYVADVDIDTGSNNPVTAPCSAPAPSAPTASLAAKVDAFVAKYKNRYLDYDGRYGAQCVDLFNFYNREVAGGAGFGRIDYAYQLYAAAPAARFDRLPASAAPRKGDIAVWASNKPYSSGAGHVAVVLSQPSSSTISVFEQNVQGSPSIVRTESTSYLLGYLRPRV